MFRIGFFGDVVGVAGRRAIRHHLPRIREQLELSFVVVNGENASHGRGINRSQYMQMLENGADAVTLGNHAFDNREALVFVEQESCIVRPINMTESLPGRGHTILTARSGERVLVANALGRIFMSPSDDPFTALGHLVDDVSLGTDVQAIMLDFHAEATSEKQGMGHFLDGRVSAVFGTHTHIPTADVRVLEGGTAYISDVGMCGDYRSVLGFEKREPVNRLVTGLNSARLEPANERATLCGVVAEIDPNTGLVERVARVIQGDDLQNTWPDWS